MSQQELQSFANWLVNNADKKGTPEFDTVAQAFKTLDSQQTGQQQPAAPQQQQDERYVDPNASRGMFAVDRAQTLAGNAIEGTGRFIEQAVPAVGGSMAEYGRSVVENNEADIARRGYQSTYQGSFRDQEGVADTLGWTGEKMVENAIPTLATYGGYAAAALTAPYSVPIATLIAGLTTVGTVGMGIGETTDELKSKVSKDDYNPNAAVIGGTIVGLLDRFGATKALGVSKAKLLTMSLDEITAALRKAGKGKIAKNIMRGMAVEGATEAAQENVIMGTAATQGAEYAGKEVLDRNIDSAVLGAAMGGSMTATTETAGKATRLFKDDGSIEDIENLTREHQQSAATFARRLDKIATGGDLNGNTFDLQDIDKMSQTGARAVVEAAHTDLVGEIADKAADLKELLRKSDQDTFDQRFKKVRAAVAQKMARNKTKSVVTAENFLALQDLVGGYTEGQALMNLIRESQIMTEVHNNDYQGKLSKFTDMFSVLGGGTGYDKSAVAVERVVRPIASLSFGLNTSGLSLLGQQAVASIGQRLDKARGTYSSVDKFIKENKDKAGLPAPRPPSFRVQRLQQAQQASTTRAGLQAYNDKKDGGDNINSPVGSILAGTGLSPDGLNKLLDYIETAPDTTPDVMVYVDQTRRNLAGEGNSIDDISPWIQAINGTLNESKELDALREDQPDNPLAQRARRRAGFGPSTAQSSAGTAQQQQQPQGRSPAEQSGIDDNRAQLEKLRQGLAANTSLTPAERGRLLTALDTLEYNLGSDPAVAAMDVVSRLKSDGISESLINRHIMPYVERVLIQQARSGRRQQPPTSTGNTDLSFDEDFDASKPALTDNVPTGAVSGTPLENSLARSFDFARRKVYTKGRDFKLDLQARALASQKSAGIDLTQVNPENIDRLADFVYADALEAIKDNQNAIGWYDRTVTEAIETLGEVYPEVLTSPKNKLQFVWALAVTSNGLKVDKNFELAAQVYETLQRTGRFPDKAGIGTAAKGINSGLKMYHTMLDKFGGDHVQLADFMNSQVPVRTIEKEYKVDVTGEGKGTLVRGASILGPKIGNGFFSNLYGNFDALTMDRWLMRTVGRWRGTLVVPNPAMEKKKRGEIKDLINGLSNAERRVLRKLYSKAPVTIKPNMSVAQLNAFAQATAKLSMDPAWREVLNLLSPEIRKSGNGLSGYLDGQQEAPKGAAERDFIREVFTSALGRLQDEPAIRQNSNQQLTMSDLQALLWYPEKRLYDTAKQTEGNESRGYEDDDAPDYANAARKVVEAIKQRDGLGPLSGDGRGGRGAAGPNAGQSFDQDLAQQGNTGVLATPPAQQPQQQSPFNMASLVNKMLGSQPATPEQVKAQLPVVRPVFEIGKAGTKYADGIQDIDSAIEFAKAINVTLKMFDSQQEMFDALGYPLQDNVRGAYRKKARVVFGMNPNAKASATLGEVTTLDSLTTVLHELGHAVAKDSGFESIIDRMMQDNSEYSDNLRKRVFKEIDNIQRNIDLYLENKPTQRRPVRRILEALQARKIDPSQTPQVNRYLAYVNRADERAVDPVLLYFVNPRLAKAVAPITSRLVKESLNAAGNQDFQMYTYPFATMVAVVLAMMLNGRAEEEEEEQQRQQMPAGALSPQAGALSQQQQFAA